MSDRKTNDTLHKMAFDAIGMAAQILTPNHAQLTALVEAERSMHGHLHITDPTLYKRAMHDTGLEQQVRLARAALAFIAVVQEIKKEVGITSPAPTEGQTGPRPGY